MVSANYSGTTLLTEDMTMPSIVRVEPSGKSQQPHAEMANESSEDGEDNTNSSTTAINGSDSTVTPAVRQKVAHEMLGRSIFSGVSLPRSVVHYIIMSATLSLPVLCCLDVSICITR